jgi:hypothetical protein
MKVNKIELAGEIGQGEREWKFCLFVPLGLQELFYMPENLTTWDLPALLSIREEGVLRIFIALKNPSSLPGFEPATFGSSGQHTNHYTTKATRQKEQEIKIVQHDYVYGGKTRN